MKISEWRSLERQLKVVEAAKRLERDEIKGITVEVVFQGNTGGGNADVPVRVFIPFDGPDFAAVYGLIEGKVGEAKADAEDKLRAAKKKFADESL